jgi:hypothetical protein
MVGEEPLEPEYFIVTPAGIECRLLDDVRNLVRCDGHAVQESSRADIGEIDFDAIDDAAADERASESGRCGGRAGDNDRGRVFDRHAERNPRTELLHRSNLPLASIVPPDHIVCLDRIGDVLLSRCDADLVLR